jgi:NAD-dependent deacetylase
LERYFDVRIITQNVDNLHERAGSTNVLHIHGELTKCRSIKDPSYIVEWEDDVAIGDLCPKGGQLRPHIVFFGEEVPLLSEAAKIMGSAEIVIIAGTSLAVHPAAGLINYAPEGADIYVIDPLAPVLSGVKAHYIKERFAIGMPLLAEELQRRKIC